MLRLLKKLPVIGQSILVPPTVPVVRLEGMIGGMGAGRRNITAKKIEPVLKRAFSIPDINAVALIINSPGGSPAQSSLIAGAIRRWSEEKQVPALAFVEDIAASGGYWLATAADEIFADRNAIIGSIGVISQGFGLHEAIEKIGVERRVYTAGKSKSVLDPFRPEKPDDIKRLKRILEGLHKNFIAQVKDRRGDKLKEDDGLFTGDFWLAEDAIEHGLIDGVADMTTLLKERFGEKVQLLPIEQKRGLFSLPWSGGGDVGGDLRGDFGGGVTDRLLESATLNLADLAEEKIIRARYGLY